MIRNEKIENLILFLFLMVNGTIFTCTTLLNKHCPDLIVVFIGFFCCMTAGISIGVSFSYFTKGMVNKNVEKIIVGLMIFSFISALAYVVLAETKYPISQASGLIVLVTPIMNIILGVMFIKIFSKKIKA